MFVVRAVEGSELAIRYTFIPSTCLCALISKSSPEGKNEKEHGKTRPMLLKRPFSPRDLPIILRAKTQCKQDLCEHRQFALQGG